MVVIIDISKETRVGFSTGAFESLSRKILKNNSTKLMYQPKRIAISVAFVDDKIIKKINKQYRGINKPTDVLSFSFLDDMNKTNPLETFIIGELVISCDTLKVQAQTNKHSQKQEAEILFTHGLLHILGYDHENKKDFKRMLEQETKILGDKSGLLERSSVE